MQFQEDAQQFNMNLTIKYRVLKGGFPPNKTKIQIPGWAGDPMQKKRDNSIVQPWHCLPYLDGIKASIELLFPGEDSYKVKNTGNEIVIEKNGEIINSSFSQEGTEIVSLLSPNHYSICPLIDIMTEEGFEFRIESHPKIYNDKIDYPIIIPANLKQILYSGLFVVALNPKPGKCHIYNPKDKIAIVIPTTTIEKLSVEKMSKDELETRENISKIQKTRSWILSTNIWHSKDFLWFDTKYKILNKILSKEGKNKMINFVKTKGK